MSEANATNDNRNDVGTLLVRQAKIIEKRASKNALHTAEWADFILTLRGLAALSDRLPPLPPAGPRPLTRVERVALEIACAAPSKPRGEAFVYIWKTLILALRKELKAIGLFLDL